VNDRPYANEPHLHEKNAKVIGYKFSVGCVRSRLSTRNGRYP